MARWCVAVVLCVAACSALEQEMPWWRTASLYQVYPRSFQDTNGDGTGDLKGITERAEYLKETGVTGIWLSPVFKSPMVDNGYDISDFEDMDPLFGTMEDFDALHRKTRELGLKLLLDFVPNHTSDEHPWFQKSVRREPGYADFYVWRDPSGWKDGEPLPPNNWESVFGGSSWEWNTERQQFYYHVFWRQQPDLNYWEPNVISNMTAILEFWMDKGIDGFRMDAVAWIYHNNSFPDEPSIGEYQGEGNTNLLTIYERNLPETLTLLQNWAEIIYRRGIEDGTYRCILLEVYETMEITMRYYGTGNHSLMFPFNFNMVPCYMNCRPADLRQLILSWMTAKPADGVPNFALGNHDNSRVSSRFGPAMVDGMNMLTAVLPGVKITYYGEEIGMSDTYVRSDQAKPDFRNPERTPMQWDNTISAGFSTNRKTWLPVNPNYWWLNVAAQRKAETSHLKVFQAMMAERKDPVLQRGDLTVFTPNSDTLAVKRCYKGQCYVFIMNMGSEDYTYTSQNLFSLNQIDMNMRVVVTSINSGLTTGYCFHQGSISLTLMPKAAVLLRSSSTVARLSVVATLLMIVSVVFS